MLYSVCYWVCNADCKMPSLLHQWVSSFASVGVRLRFSGNIVFYKELDFFFGGGEGQDTSNHLHNYVSLPPSTHEILSISLDYYKVSPVSPNIMNIEFYVNQTKNYEDKCRLMQETA